jgi:hypothetical protein
VIEINIYSHDFKIKVRQKGRCSLNFARDRTSLTLCYFGTLAIGQRPFSPTLALENSKYTHSRQKIVTTIGFQINCFLFFAVSKRKLHKRIDIKALTIAGFFY